MFTKNGNGPSRACTSDEAPRRRGRPSGQTEQGAAAKRRLYRAAITLMARNGYTATTLRDIAAEAGVSVGLLYRYFPSKQTVLLALYDELSVECAARITQLPAGPWRDRFLAAVDISLGVLSSERETIAALVPVLLTGADEGLFSGATAFSRERVESLFQHAVSGATDAPPSGDAASLARALYVLHLAVILWWLLDKSPEQQATRRLLALVKKVLPAVSLALRLEPARAYVRAIDAIVHDAFFRHNEVSASETHSAG